MRPIKFRVRNEKNEIIAYEELAKNKNGNMAWRYYLVTNKGLGEWQWGCSGIVGEREQCSGLNDKNNREIYENDMIKVPSFSTHPKSLSKIEIVEFRQWERSQNESQYGFNPILQLNPRYSSFDSKSCEVIGDVFNNSDLLK